MSARTHQRDIDQRDDRHAGLLEQGRERREIQVAHQDHLHVVRFGRTRRCAASQHLKTWITPRDAVTRSGNEPDRYGGMVPKFGPDAGQVAHDLDAERLKVRGRADPGAKQNRWRGEGAGREHDPSAMDLLARREPTPIARPPPSNTRPTGLFG